MRINFLISLFLVGILNACDGGEVDYSSKRGEIFKNSGSAGTPTSEDAIVSASEKPDAEEEAPADETPAARDSLEFSWDAADDVEITHYFLRIEEGAMTGWEQKFEVGTDVDVATPKATISYADGTELFAQVGSKVCFVLVAASNEGESTPSSKLCETL